jgi:hypothetical protein
MKFTIEVLRIGDGAEEILGRSEHDAIAPKWMKTRAQPVLNAWKSAAPTALECSIEGASRSIAGERISIFGHVAVLAAMLFPTDHLAVAHSGAIEAEASWRGFPD